MTFLNIKKAPQKRSQARLARYDLLENLDKKSLLDSHFYITAPKRLPYINHLNYKITNFYC